MTQDLFENFCAVYGLAPSKPLRDLVLAVMEHERESCIRICEMIARNASEPSVNECVTIIRARGEK